MEKRVVEKCSRKVLYEGCRDVLEKSFAEKYCREVEKCCRGVVGKSVGEESCRELLEKRVAERSVAEKCSREAAEKSVREESCR